MAFKVIPNFFFFFFSFFSLIQTFTMIVLQKNNQKNQKENIDLKLLTSVFRILMTYIQSCKEIAQETDFFHNICVESLSKITTVLRPSED